MDKKFLTRQGVILAAGESSRFWPLNRRHKSLFKIMGRPLICYTIESLKKAGIKDIIVVQGPEKDIEGELKNYDLGINIKYVIQAEPKGMGNALWQVKNLLKGRFLILNAERVDIDEILNLHPPAGGSIFNSKVKSVLFGQKTESPQFFGMARFKEDRILEIIEKPRKGKEPSNIRIVGIYLLEPSFFEIYKRVVKFM